MSDKDRIPAEVFILFKLEGLKTALSDSPYKKQQSLTDIKDEITWISAPIYFIEKFRNISHISPSIFFNSSISSGYNFSNIVLMFLSSFQFP